MHPLVRTAWRWSWGALALLLIAAAVLLTVARLMLPFASEYRAEIEQHLSRYLEAPVSIGQLDVEWHGLGPRLRLDDLRITAPERAPVRAERAYLDLALIPATDGFPLRIRGVSLVGVEAEVEIDDAGRPSLWGLALGGSGPSGAGGLARRLFAVERLQVLDARITVEASDGRRAVLRQVEMRLANDGQRHRLAASVQLPPPYGDELRVALDLRGPLGAYDEWQGSAYLTGTGLALSEWLRPWREFAGLDGGGRGDAEVWARWSGGRLQHLQTDVRLRDLELAAAGAGAAVTFDRLDGRIAWARTTRGWRVDGADIEVARDGRAWSTDGFSVAREHPEGQAPTWRGQVGFARVGDVVALARLAPLPDPIGRRLERLAAGRDLRGAVRDLTFRAGGDDDFAVRGRLQDLGWSPDGKIPGVTGVDGRLALGASGGWVELATDAATVDAPKLFREPLPVADLRGRVDVTRGAAGMRIRAHRLHAANGDVRTTSRFDLRLPADDAARIDMQVDFAEGSVAAISRYLPVGAMSGKVVDWIDRALVSGRIVDGRMLWRGPVAEFPHGDPGGVFEVDMRVAGARVDYAPDWPGLAEANGRVRFRGPSMEIHADGARLFGTAVSSLDARIDDFADARLQVRAQARGPLADLVRVVNDSPLQRHLGAFFRGAEAGGPAGVAVDLWIPLRHVAGTRARGTVHLAGSRFAQPRFGLRLAQLDGEVRFTDDSLSIDGLTARVRGDPITIDARTRTGATPAIEVGAHGRIGVDALLPGLPEDLAERVDGRAPWRLEALIPLAKPEGGRGPIVVRGASDLVGTAIDLPAPLGKAADRRRPFDFELPIGPDGSLGPGRVGYGGLLQARLALGGPREDLRIERGVVRFGDTPGPVPPPDAPGIHLRGRLAELDLGPWIALLRERRPEGAGEPGAGSAGIVGADLHVGRAGYRGYEASDLRVEADRRGASWHVALDGPDLAGRAVVPADPDPTARPLRLRLERLDMAALRAGDAAERSDGGDAGRSGPDPRTLPPLDLRVDRLGLAEGSLRDVAVVTAPTSDGLTIRRLQFDNAHLSLEGGGHWRGGADPETALRLTLRSDDLGAGMEALGQDGIFGRTQGRVTADLAWPGPPWSPDAGKLDGHARIRLADGVLKAVEPGAARLFGLLDLRGLLESGFQFEELGGLVEFDDGQASTRNLTIDGSAGRLKVRGRTGLVDRDYDHTIVFRPALSSSLPVIGALSGGPAAGVAVALVQGLLRTLGADVETAAELTYTLTGSWDDPSVRRVTTDPAGATGARNAPASGARR